MSVPFRATDGSPFRFGWSIRLRRTDCQNGNSRENAHPIPRAIHFQANVGNNLVTPIIVIIDPLGNQSCIYRLIELKLRVSPLAAFGISVKFISHIHLFFA